MNDAIDLVDPLNKLLRGEISAVETYEAAFKKAEGASRFAELQTIELDHRESAKLLEEQIVRCGGTPDHTSGAWGVWAKTVQGAANLLGDSSALKALKEGEEHGLKDYQALLSEPDLSEDLRALITSSFIPKQQGHIPVLDRLMDVRY